MKNFLKKWIVSLTLLCLVAVILAHPGRLMSAQAFVQGTSGAQATFASTVNATFASPLTNGSIIIVAFEADLQTTRANTPTDTAGNTYLLATSSNSAHLGIDQEVWYAQNTHTTASDKVTVSDNGGGVRSAIVIQEFTGQASGNPVDQVVGNDPGTVGTAITSGNTGTLSQANEEVLCLGLNNLNSNSLTLGAGYTNLNQTHQASPTGIGLSSKSVSSTAAVSCVMTTASANWEGIAVTIKDAAAVAATTPSTVQIQGTVNINGLVKI